MKRFTYSQLFFFSLVLGLSACGQQPVPECGNGIVEDSEQCDDGNTISGDGCSEACELEDECGESCQAINDYVRGLEPVPTSPASEVANSETRPQVTKDGNYACSTINLSKTVPLTEVSILSGVTNDLFPGAILHGDSLSNGTFAVSGIDQGPLTYSLSVLDGTSAPRSATMQEPSLSQFRDTFGIVLSQANLSDVPVSAKSQIEEIRNEQDLSLALGVDVDTTTTDVKGSFNFENKDFKSRFLITVDMAFFTADLDTNLQPSDFFADSVTLEQVQSEFGDSVPPVYVSSVTYGTRYYVAVESIFSEEEARAALDVAFDKGTTSVDGSVTLSTKEVLQNTNLTAIAVGAKPDELAAFNSILSGENRLDGVKNFLTNGEHFSAANIGKPLLFTMKNMSDNSVAALAFSNTTDVLTCDRISQNIQVTLESISLDNGSDFGNNDLEIYGTISAQSINTGILFEHADNDVEVIPNTGVPKPFGGAQFQKTIRIDPTIPTANITLAADLTEDDGNNGDDDMPFRSLQINKDSTGATTTQDGNEVLLGEGFNGVYELLVSSAEGDLTLTFSLRPIP
ncbi:MAG TPA: thiol-activated cytolysin family protein [Lacunisphaera sp.]|nr:thiol-activated cytolysin family protein [Lacunisphaera sp.]